LTAAEAPPRIATLDILRGVAVMGIFSVNAISFAMPSPAYLNPAAYGGAAGGNLAEWVLNFVLIDNKMRGLFSLLFGASLLLVVERAEAAGLSPAAVHYRRMGWLLAFGIAHFYLVWTGDILSLYAPIGMIAYAFRKMPVERLLIAAGIFLALDLAMMAELAQSIAAGEAGAAAPHASAAALAQWQADAADLIPMQPVQLAADLALYRGAYGDILHERLTDEALDPLFNLIAIGPQTLGLMLLGMAGLRSGFLTGGWNRRAYARVAWICLPGPAVVHAFLAWHAWRGGFSASRVFANYFLFSAPFYLMMIVGYAAAVILLARRGGWLVDRIAAAGRAAFTNYLGTSLIAAGLFYGFGWYGRFSRWETWLLVPMIWALMLIWSKPWLERFRYGPFEWLWRSLARGSRQPMRKAASSVTVG
jgi:uncharacterized protein